MNSAENSLDNPVELYRRLRGHVRPYRLKLALGIVCGILYGAATFGLLAAMRFALVGISGAELGLSGIPDLAAYAAPTGCGAAVPELLGGDPDRVPERLRRTSPIEPQRIRMRSSGACQLTR